MLLKNRFQVSSFRNVIAIIAGLSESRRAILRVPTNGGIREGSYAYELLLLYIVKIRTDYERRPLPISNPGQYPHL